MTGPRARGQRLTRWGAARRRRERALQRVDVAAQEDTARRSIVAAHDSEMDCIAAAIVVAAFRCDGACRRGEGAESYCNHHRIEGDTTTDLFLGSPGTAPPVPGGNAPRPLTPIQRSWVISYPCRGYPYLPWRG